MVEKLKLFQPRSHVLEGNTVIFVLKKYHSLIVRIQL